MISMEKWKILTPLQECGRFGQTNCCHRLWKVAQSSIHCQIWPHCSPPPSKKRHLLTATTLQLPNTNKKGRHNSFSSFNCTELIARERERDWRKFSPNETGRKQVFEHQIVAVVVVETTKIPQSKNFLLLSLIPYFNRAKQRFDRDRGRVVPTQATLYLVDRGK